MHDAAAAAYKRSRRWRQLIHCAYFLHALKKCKLTVVGPESAPSIRCGLPVAAHKRRLWHVVEEYKVPYVVALGTRATYVMHISKEDVQSSLKADPHWTERDEWFLTVGRLNPRSPGLAIATSTSASARLSCRSSRCASGRDEYAGASGHQRHCRMGCRMTLLAACETQHPNGCRPRPVCHAWATSTESARP